MLQKQSNDDADVEEENGDDGDDVEEEEDEDETEQLKRIFEEFNPGIVEDVVFVGKTSQLSNTFKN